jgi:hypothetical protein
VEGDPKDAPPSRPPGTSGLPGVNLDLAPAPYVTSGDTDDFECFVLDPNLTQDAWVNGVFFVPGNPKVVHHAAIVSDPTRASLSYAGAGGRYNCFGGTKLTSSNLLGVWAPGGVPIDLPPDIGTPVPAGSLLVMQVHYHPAGTTADPDATHAQLRFTSGKPTWALYTSAVGNYPTALPGGDGLQPKPTDPPTGPSFRIPANEAAHIESMQFTMPSTINGYPIPPIYVYGVMPHMHLAGFDIKIELDKADGSSSACLIQDPDWRFAWQRFYAYDAPIESLPLLAAGDKVKVRCTYNNTVQNQQLEAARKAQTNGIPEDIFLGEETLDEMCLAIPQLLVGNP